MDYDTAVKTLSTTPLIAPCYYIVGGPGPKQVIFFYFFQDYFEFEIKLLFLKGAVITRNRENSADVWNLGTNNTWFLAETNYDHWKAPLFIDDRITPCNNCMNKLGQDNFDFAGLFNVLSSKPVLNKLTVYTALIETQTGRMETYIQYCKTPCWPF